MLYRYNIVIMMMIEWAEATQLVRLVNLRTYFWVLIWPRNLKEENVSRYDLRCDRYEHNSIKIHHWHRMCWGYWQVMDAWRKLISVIDECEEFHINWDCVFFFLRKQEHKNLRERKRAIFFCSYLIFNIICNQAAQRRHVTVYIPN